ncbi:MAG: aminotransferase class I/II-fold pyridoxal phosphate-dependent enzyme [Tabrizicola sp.]|nr:aminotransferase class I/II-fold pyridoxal phosphate-dependent enzyme [Tabrizicola sp.]
MPSDIERAHSAIFLEERQPFGAIAPPISMSSTFAFETHEDLASRYRGENPDPLYSRTENPTVTLLEEKLAALEGGEGAIALGSGMAAISSAVLALVRSGDRVVAIRNSYSDAHRFFDAILPRLGVQTHYVDAGDFGAVEAALIGARLFYLESPSSYVFDCFDIPALTRKARAAGAITLFDNSFASPLRQNPLAHGVDLVVHSMSKYLSGHSDVVAGCIVGSAVLIETIRTGVSPFLGSKLSAFEAWLVLRGLRTLPVRLEAHERSAAIVAEALAGLPQVLRVLRPGISAPLPPTLRGAGGLMTVEFDAAVDIPTFCNALKVFRLAVSWGGFESLALPADVTQRPPQPHSRHQSLGINRHMVRLFIGLEGAEALRADLLNAITAATGRG